MPYTCRVFDSVDEVDQESWQHVRSSGVPTAFTDLRFIAAVEVGMRECCECRQANGLS